MATHRYRNLEERLIWNSVLMDGPLDTPCWIWIGHRNNRGYPVITMRVTGISYPVSFKAHRVSLLVFKGVKLPESTNTRRWTKAEYKRRRLTKHGLHRCDDPGCINPEHLRWGTNKENVQDSIARGRAPHMVPKKKRGKVAAPPAVS